MCLCVCVGDYMYLVFLSSSLCFVYGSLCVFYACVVVYGCIPLIAVLVN